MTRRVTRREFIGIVAGGALAAAAIVSFYVLGQTPSLSTDSYPKGNRVIRLRTIDETGWVLPQYTTAEVISWLEDLKPTTLNRYTSGPINPSLSLPSPSGEQQMTAQAFLQASLDACRNPNSTTMFPRLTFNLFSQSGSSAFLQAAQQIYNIYSSLSPPQTLLSIDNFNNNSTPGDAVALSKSLFSMGWTGLCWGACGADILPKGVGTFAMICVTPTSGAVDYGTMQSLRSIGGYGEFEAQIDFPSPMSKFASLSPDTMADLLTSLAQGQVSGGYHYMYPIIQERSANTQNTFGWDSTQIFTSQTGKYGGQSLYQVMKGLMQTYN